MSVCHPSLQYFLLHIKKSHMNFSHSRIFFFILWEMLSHMLLCHSEKEKFHCYLYCDEENLCQDNFPTFISYREIKKTTSRKKIRGNDKLLEFSLNPWKLILFFPLYFTIIFLPLCTLRHGKYIKEKVYFFWSPRTNKYSK
jgi:hypothetical protein